MKPLFARRAAAMVVLFAGAHAASGAVIIDDRSFFQGKPHTFIDFETRADGSPLNLGFKGGRLIPADEYASFGIRFVDLVIWQDIGTPPNAGDSLADALAAIGSWPTVLATSEAGFSVEFLTPVHSFGLGVAQTGFVHFLAPDPDYTTTITAFNADGAVIGVVRLWGDLIDGGFGGLYAGGLYGDLWKIDQFGFLGLATEEPIARLRFDNAWQSVLDDLHFSAIPAPGAGAALGLLTLGALARRRRSSGG